MINKPALSLFIAVAALGIASPVLAQSFDKTDGTGNELPAYYDAYGGLHFGTARRNDRIAGHRNGLYSFAQVQVASDYCIAANRRRFRGITPSECSRHARLCVGAHGLLCSIACAL